MQAIAETLFDAVYLISVVTIGILMIRGSGQAQQFRLFGWMAVVLGAGDSFHLIPRGAGAAVPAVRLDGGSPGGGRFLPPHPPRPGPVYHRP